VTAVRKSRATSYLGLHLAIGLIVAALAIWAFGALIDEVLEQSALVRWDVATAARLHAAATPMGTTIARVVSDVGSPATMFAIGAIATLRLWRRARLHALTWLGAIFGGGVLDQVLKHSVHRSRPVGSVRYLHIDSFSFPSGHAMLATLGFGMLAFAARRALGRNGAAGYATAAVGVLAVAASRLYLGVHFPTDVLGGMLAGAAWLALCLTGTSMARDRAAAASD
jgi:undecaprenyl-diphosphatase